MRGEGISRETEKGVIYADRCGAYLWRETGEDEAIAVAAMQGCHCRECENLLGRFKLLRILDKTAMSVEIHGKRR